MALNKHKMNRMTRATKQAALGDKFDATITLLNEMRTDLNALRDDMRKHDHGAAYAQQTMRINASTVTISGTESNTAVDAPAVDVLN